MTKVINIKHSKGSAEEVYIGRGSKWGNKFRIGVNGSRDEVVAKYEEWVLKQDELVQALDELKGKTLVCFCKPLACHGDVLIRLIGN